MADSGHCCAGFDPTADQLGRTPALVRRGLHRAVCREAPGDNALRHRNSSGRRGRRGAPALLLLNAARLDAYLRPVPHCRARTLGVIGYRYGDYGLSPGPASL